MGFVLKLRLNGRPAIFFLVCVFIWDALFGGRDYVGGKLLLS